MTRPNGVPPRWSSSSVGLLLLVPIVYLIVVAGTDPGPVARRRGRCPAHRPRGVAGAGCGIRSRTCRPCARAVVEEYGMDPDAVESRSPAGRRGRPARRPARRWSVTVAHEGRAAARAAGARPRAPREYPHRSIGGAEGVALLGVGVMRRARGARMTRGACCCSPSATRCSRSSAVLICVERHEPVPRAEALGFPRGCRGARRCGRFQSLARRRTASRAPS